MWRQISCSTGSVAASRKRGVVRAGAGLDDAARDHLAGAGAAPRAVDIEIDLIAGLKPGERCGEIESRVGQLRPARQRLAVLDFLHAPALARSR